MAGMIEQAKEHIKRGLKGVLTACLVIAATTYALIWVAIEPLGVPDQVTLSLPRWVAHVTGTALFSLVLTAFLAISVRRSPRFVLPEVPFDHLYRVDQAVAFYDAVATKYDNRNSAPLLQTHSRVVERIRQQIQRKPELRVLDLGGGTGRGIAHHFFDNDQIYWEYVDNSPNMIDEFRKNFEGTRLQSEIHYEGIEAYLSRKPAARYDVVILSFVLTSMTANPDWGSVAALLAGEGVLIIADIDASYTAIHPYYVIEVSAASHGLEPRPIPLTELIDQINQKHLRFMHSYPVREFNRSYSFVAEFVKDALKGAASEHTAPVERALYYVLMEENRWKIRHNDRDFDYGTQRDAVTAAIHAAHSAGRSGHQAEVLVQQPDGAWRVEWTYGRDPLLSSD